MKTTAHTSQSTQLFTEIIDVRENIVLLKGGNACIVIQVSAVNFALLSKDEQDAKVYAYASLLNSLSFPIQILIRSKQIDILPYIASLGTQAKLTTNTKLAQNIMQYKGFVEKLVTQTTVLDKECYMVIGYSSLEDGITGARKIAHLNPSDMDDFFIKAKASLGTKADSLLAQIDRMALRARVLEGDNLIKIFHDLFNGEASPLSQDATNSLHVSGKGGMS